MKRKKLELVERYRRESSLLGPQHAGSLNFPINKNSKSDIESELARIDGAPDGKNKGKYHMVDRRAGDGSFYHLAKIPDLKFRIRDLEKQFARFQISELENGNKRPDEYPPELREKRDELNARLTVGMEEKKLLLSFLEPLLKEQVEKEEAILPRRQWGTWTTENGVKTRLGGFKVGKLPPENGEEQDPTLYLLDDRCPYNGLQVHAFKSIVLQGLSLELNFRIRSETKSAIAENRAKRPVQYPQAPIWHKEKNTWEFPGWAPRIIDRISKNL